MAPNAIPVENVAGIKWISLVLLGVLSVIFGLLVVLFPRISYEPLSVFLIQIAESELSINFQPWSENPQASICRSKPHIYESGRT